MDCRLSPPSPSHSTCLFMFLYLCICFNFTLLYLHCRARPCRPALASLPVSSPLLPAPSPSAPVAASPAAQQGTAGGPLPSSATSRQEPLQGTGAAPERRTSPRLAQAVRHAASEAAAIQPCESTAERRESLHDLCCVPLRYPGLVWMRAPQSGVP